MNQSGKFLTWIRVTYILRIYLVSGKGEGGKEGRSEVEEGRK